MTTTDEIDLAVVRKAIIEANRELVEAQNELAGTLHVLDQRERADKTMITTTMRTALARVAEAQRKLLSLDIT